MKILKFSKFSSLVLALVLAACGSGQSPTGIDAKSEMSNADTSATVAAGVRKDIAAYIDVLPDTAAQKQVLRQSALAYDAALTVDTTNRSAVFKVAEEISAAAWCRHTQYQSLAVSKTTEIQNLAVNTEARAASYEKFNTALNGTPVFSVAKHCMDV